MIHCPNCGVSAVRQSEQAGLFWTCPGCQGSSSTISSMRKVIPRDIVNSLWNAAKEGVWPKKRTCPSCSHRMVEVSVAGEGFAVDICTACAFVWFDAGEFSRMPKVPRAKPARKPLSPELTRQIALHRVEHIRERARLEKSAPDEAWKYIPALLGIPVEFDCEYTRCKPMVTYSLLALVAAVSVLGFTGILSPSEFGLIPAKWSRLGGLTFLTCFFLHSGLGHLAGNLYFLYVFGDNVEDFLGKAKYVALLVAATVIGGLAYVLCHPGSTAPCIGASGGISGILAYYALRFPKNRIGVFFFFHWFKIPVVAYLGVWVLMQLFGVFSGTGRVAYMAHIGGMLTGVFYWLSERYLRPVR